ncbi:ABC transporter ATP-binding protein [Chitinophaga sp. sic0106]|uniref:ABC transporter ATP-binding protein n=1 Tax=Chitinophaga sp. sic0106 TaxID=2854785 RepID=UPI001C45C06C|nr:ABC transporter ATP-binding protein [Chitinophaga sp. sic0106]MBV7530043.1 ABC transporter ATP-binding protein [Chitinophaga sp. sic0106]
MDAVVLDGITKTYADGKILAVDHVSLTVKRGELFGLIGPDGAGKTSIFRILTTLLLADKGTASVQGLHVVKDYRQIRKILGYMPGKFSLYQDLTVHENLTFFATLFDTTIEENYDIIRDIYEQLKPFSDRRAGKLSGGMKQKLALCCALIHKPEVLFLDEPTTGVDVVSRREFWDILARLKSMGITILVSTPYMDEAGLCERIALIQAGSIMQIDTPDNIIHSYPVRLYAAKSANIYGLLKDMRDNASVESCFAFGEYLHLTLKEDSGHAVTELEAFAQQKGHTGIAVKEISPGIEDTFIRLMNQKSQ